MATLFNSYEENDVFINAIEDRDEYFRPREEILEPIGVVNQLKVLNFL